MNKELEAYKKIVMTLLNTNEKLVQILKRNVHPTILENEEIPLVENAIKDLRIVLKELDDTPKDPKDILMKVVKNHCPACGYILFREKDMPRDDRCPECRQKLDAY